MRHMLHIEGMSCAHCVRAVKGALSKVEGVDHVQVEIGQATVDTRGDMDPQVLRAAVESEGYKVKPG